MPAGSYEFKVAINHSWDENYGAGGAANGANIPLVLKGAATVEFSYDDVTHQVGIRPTELSGPGDQRRTGRMPVTHCAPA